MRKAFIVLVLLGSLLSAPAEIALVGSAQAQARPSPNTPAWEAMWRSCRKAVFRKYGNRLPERPGKVFLSADRASVLTDACIANGGRVN